MEEKLMAFLGGRRQVPWGKWTLRVLSAWEVLQARAQAEVLAQQERELGLCLNACILAASAHRWGRPVFVSGEQVLKKLTAEQIEAGANRYFALCRREDPGCCQPDWRHWQEALSHESYERLKWQILKSFSVLPSEKRAREMTDGDYLYCAVQTILDKEEQMANLCPGCRQELEEKRCRRCGQNLGQENENFDEKRYEELKRDALSR